MFKSHSVSSDYEDLVLSEDLLGPPSRRWLRELRSDGRVSSDLRERPALGRDGLYVDYHFPRGPLEMHPRLVWKRPKEISGNPQFIVDGATHLDIHQGDLYDCWFLAAIASLSVHRALLNQVVPPGQSFQDGYDGSFIFRFWQYGDWKEVKIDDLLPTHNNSLHYLSSPNKHEFWTPLLEKAYAKIKGGYRALDMGFAHEAMVDMTGGVTEGMSVRSLPRDAARCLRRMLLKGALISCANCQGKLGQSTNLGIMYKHAYSVTEVEEVKTAHGPVDLVRILNPWGHTEWMGSWSDDHGVEWKSVSVEEQKRLQRVQREDGEFWMSVSDFQQQFDQMEVCYLSESFQEPGSGVQPWLSIVLHGEWVPGVSAGGSQKDDVFWQNPQFCLDLVEMDSDSSECSFIVALMHKHQRRNGTKPGIGLYVFQAQPSKTSMSPEDLRTTRAVLYEPHRSPSREVVLRGSLPKGRYIIIPSMSHPNQQGAFLLRVLTEKGNTVTSSHKPPQEVTVAEVPLRSSPHEAALPAAAVIKTLFYQNCNKKRQCKPFHLHKLLTEAMQTGVLAGSEKYLSLEYCKSMVVLMDTQGIARLNWDEFKDLWEKIKKWTDIFIVHDRNKTMRLDYEEVPPALTAAGVVADTMVMQLVGLRYTEPDMTLSYPGFLYLMMKMDAMIQKFKDFDLEGRGSINLTYRQWLHMTMYN